MFEVGLKMFYEIDDKTRFLVIYQDVTQKASSISRYTGISERTIRYWISQVENGEDILNVKEGRGRKKALHDDDLEEIEEEVKDEPYKASTRNLASEYNISRTTIASSLHDLGFNYKSVHTQPPLTDEHKLQRIWFCQDMLQDISQIYRIWFSDEMGYNLQEVRGKVWTQEDYFLSERPKREKVNVWVAFSAFGKTSLDLYEENLDAGVYIKILERHYNEMVRVNWRHYSFQQDNLSSHGEAGVQKWFKAKAINLLDWPSNSPDLNPVENLWGWLKQEVKKENPRSLDDMKASLVRNWNKTTINFLKNFIDSLPQRFRLCIENGGERLPY